MSTNVGFLLYTLGREAWMLELFMTSTCDMFKSDKHTSVRLPLNSAPQIHRMVPNCYFCSHMTQMFREPWCWTARHLSYLNILILFIFSLDYSCEFNWMWIKRISPKKNTQRPNLLHTALPQLQGCPQPCAKYSSYRLALTLSSQTHHHSSVSFFGSQSCLCWISKQHRYIHTSTESTFQYQKHKYYAKMRYFHSSV